MKVILLALGLTILIELVTIYMRMVVHLRSAPIQKKLHMPRIHHSYPGFAILLIDYVYLQNEYLFILGFALVLSDVIHHLIFEPYIYKYKYDIGMKNHSRAHDYVATFPAAVALILIGLFALVTPFTPGSWLALVGVGMLAGKSPQYIYETIKQKFQPPKKKRKKSR